VPAKRYECPSMSNGMKAKIDLFGSEATRRNYPIKRADPLFYYMCVPAGAACLAIVSPAVFICKLGL